MTPVSPFHSSADEPPPPGPVQEGIEIALSNIVQMARMIPGSLGAVTNGARPDLISGLTQSLAHAIGLAAAHLTRFGIELSEIGMPNAAQSERARARAILLDLDDWMKSTMMRRTLSGTQRPVLEWIVPTRMLALMEDLAQIGRTLRATWVEARASQWGAHKRDAVPLSSPMLETRVYLMFRDWTKWPDWFEVPKVDSASDDELMLRVQSYLKKRLRQIDEPARDEFVKTGVLKQIEDVLALDPSAHSLKWRVFGWADSDERATAMIAVIKKRMGLALTYSRLPRAGLPTDGWMLLEREIRELDEQIRHKGTPQSSYQWTDFYTPTTRQRLRMEAVELATIAAEAPQALEPQSQRDEGLKSNGEQNDEITHAADFSWLIARGDSYKFTTPNQRAVIEALFDAWESSGKRDGHGLAEAAIATAIGTPSGRPRIGRLFVKSDALENILASPTKGVWALYLNGPPPKPV